MIINNPVLLEIWKDRYCKNNESLVQNFKRVANYIGENDDQKHRFFNIMNQGKFIPAGRTMSNAGIGKQLTLNNCFLNPLIEDDMESIFDGVKLSALTHKAGGGIGMDFSQIRPNGSPTSNDAVASGVVSFMDVYNTQTATIMQGSRRGANMGVLSIYHPDIEEYINAKSYDDGKLVHFNMSVMVDNDFMYAVENNKDIYLHYPIYDEKYHIIKDEGKWKIKKKIKAKDLWDKITKKAYMNGEPGVLFYDNMNNDNNTWYTETITHTNPCGEYLAGTVFNQEMPSKEYGGACNLGSVFIHNLVLNPFKSNASVDIKGLKNAVETGVELLDRIIDINNFPSDIYKNYQNNFRTIGLGITGLADAMVMLGIKYGSNESVQFASDIMNFITKTAYKKSIELSKENGSFKFLDREKFVNSGFIEKHLYDDEWIQIKNDILKYGIRNARLISVAPTGTTSLTYGNNCSSGLEPIFSLEYDRKVKIGGQSDDDVEIVKMQDYAYSVWKDVKVDNAVTEDKFVTAMNLTVDDHIRVLSAIAFHVDMSCSKTINIPSEYSFEDTKEVYFKCWKAGIKGCTIFRPNEIRQGILLTESSTKQEINETLKRGDWKEKAKDTVYYQRKIKIGCGKLSLFIGWSNTEKCIQDLYVQRTGQGGCEKNIQSTVIAMSGMLRLGGNIFNIEKAFGGLGACNSFATQRAKGKPLSKGASCGTAILNEVKLFLSEIEQCDVEVKNVKETNEKNEELLTKEDREFIEKNGEMAFAKKFCKCPICGEQLAIEGGCNICKVCSYSSCG